MKKYLFISALPLLLLTSCTIHGINEVNVHNYGGDSKYSIGGADLDSTFENIKVKWVSGSINVTYNDKNTFSFLESAVEELDDAKSLHYWANNETLYITPAASGTYKQNELKKDLFISIPKDYVLSLFDLDTVSGDFTSNIECKSTNIDTVSTDINITQNDGGHLKIDNVSGEINLNYKSWEKIEINTVSATTKITCPENYKVNPDIDTISGTLKTEGVIVADDGSIVNVDSVSGSIEIKGTNN